MKAMIVRIGNSRGIRIPKPVLQQCGLQGEVDMAIRGQELVIQAAHRPRARWAEAFQKMARLRDDQLLDSQAIHTTTWDDKEWAWK